MGRVFIALTGLQTVHGRLAIKWQVGRDGPFPDTPEKELPHLLRLLSNPWVIGAMICWMGAMTEFGPSKAYAFMALNFVLVGVASIRLFNEQLRAAKVAGVPPVVVGLVVLSRG